MVTRGRPHTSPQVWGTRPSFLFHSGLRSFLQKHLYSLGKVSTTNWQPGHLQPDSMVADLAHFLTQPRWKI